MLLNPTIFRENDIRGIAEQDLPSEGIVLLGQALGTYIQRHSESRGRRVNVGRDVRLSSPRLRDALVSGLVRSGCEVADVGCVPTPVLYHSCIQRPADGGVMITGSHNPPEYNGFKTVCGSGTIHGAEIQLLRRMIESGDLLEGAGSVVDFDGVTPYVDEVGGLFRFDRRVKVVLDAGNGTAGPVLSRLFARLNCEVTELFFEMDGRFPNHHPDPTLPENLEILIRHVREQKADLGMAFDGDSDRIGVVDELGNVIYGDMLMLIYGREILTRKPGSTFISEVKCSQIMYDELNRLGGRAIMYKTGHSLIKSKMKEENAELAGEMSGHIFFADRYHGFDDALYAACRLIEIVDRSGKPLSAQLEGVPKTVTTPELRADCPDDQKFGIVQRVKAHFQGKREVNDIDGVRVLFPHGWGLLRASNTQPVLVMRFEAETQEQLAAYRDEVESALAAAR
jgi:phosphomannomutase / phosphoglucomutase